jgi:hypothetical protein
VSSADNPAALTWGEFAALEPELAAFGVERLTAAPAYLATVRGGGAPRVHPVTPIFTESGLFLYMEPTSPKARDLEQRSWFALHNGVPDNAGSGGEVHVVGHGLPIEDVDIWSQVADASSYVPADRYILFELMVVEVRSHGYGDVPMPDTKRWPVPE